MVSIANPVPINTSAISFKIIAESILPKANKCVTITLEGPNPSSIFNKKDTGTNNSKYNPKTQFLYPSFSNKNPPIKRAITADKVLFSPPSIVAFLVSNTFSIAIIPAAAANSSDYSCETIIAKSEAKAVLIVLDTIDFFIINSYILSLYYLYPICVSNGNFSHNKSTYKCRCLMIIFNIYQTQNQRHYHNEKCKKRV